MFALGSPCFLDLVIISVRDVLWSLFVIMHYDDVLNLDYLFKKFQYFDYVILNLSPREAHCRLLHIDVIMAVDLPVPLHTDSPISRHTRSATLTRKRGCSILGLLPPGPGPFQRSGLRRYPFG